MRAAAIFTALGCEGPPARLAAGTGDTVIVHTLRPTQIPTRVFDASGRALPDSAVRYKWVGGDPVAISPTGTVTCVRPADATVRGTLATLLTTVHLRCRPVKSATIIGGPIQLLLADSAQDVVVEALGPDGELVDLLAGSATILDSSIATLDGLRVRPRRPGSTIVYLRIGDHLPGAGVHVYEPVATLAGLGSHQKFVAVRLALAGGEVRQWPLQAGNWMLTMLPYEDAARGLRLRIEGATCAPSSLSPRRFTCRAKSAATVIVYNPFVSSPDSLTGVLLLREVYP